MVDTWKWKWRESWKLRHCVQNVKVPVWKKWGGRTLDFSNVSSATLRSQYESVRFYTTRCIPKCKYICLYIHLFVKLYNTGHQTGHLSHCAVSIAELILVCGFPSTAGNNKQSPHVVFFTQITKLHCNPQQHVFLAKLYYTSLLGFDWEKRTIFWDQSQINWDQFGSIPKPCHPKPRPTTPTDFSEISTILYQKEIGILEL